MERIIRSLGRTPRQRNTVYGDVTAERYRASFLPGYAAADGAESTRALQ